MYHVFFIHSSLSEHLGCFQVLAPVDSTTVNPEDHVPLHTESFSGYVPRSGIARSCGRSVFKFLRETPYCSLQWLYQFHSHHRVGKGGLLFLHTLSRVYCL